MLKKLFAIIIFAAAGISAMAEVVVENVSAPTANDKIFMDMACTAARRSIASDGPATGAVLILNGAWRATGIPDVETSAEENAILRSHNTNLANAVIYTVNRPTAEAYAAICRAGVGAVYFVNDIDAAVKAGVFPQTAYQDYAVPDGTTAVPLRRMAYAEASSLISAPRK